MNEHEIVIDINGVTIADQRILRPRGTAISEWMGFWEAVQALAATGSFKETADSYAPRRTRTVRV